MSITTNVSSTTSINCHSKKVRDIAYNFISDHITTDNYYHLLLLCKTKRYNKKFSEINGFTGTDDETRYLTFFGSEKYGAIYGRIRYIICLKSDITYFFLTILQKSNLILVILCL